MAFVKVELKNGIYHQDVGYGTCSNSCCKGYAIARARKVGRSLQPRWLLLFHGTSWHSLQKLHILHLPEDKTTLNGQQPSITILSSEEHHLYRTCLLISNQIHLAGNIQVVPKRMSQTSPGYSPPLIKQKSSYQQRSKSEQVPRYPLLCRNPRNAVINMKHATMSNA